MKYVESQITSNSNFITLNDVDFYRLTFVFCPLELRAKFENLDPVKQNEMVDFVKEMTHKLCAQLYENNTVCIDEHALEDAGNKIGLGKDKKYNVMAISIGNPMMTIQDIDKAMNHLIIGAEALREEIGRRSLKLSTKEYIIGGPAGWNV
jgi:hypothetical protein